NPITLDGNATLQVGITDGGEPGTNDSLAVMVWDKSGAVWYSSKWTGTLTAKQVLGGGNLQVRNATASLAAAAPATDGTESVTSGAPTVYAVSRVSPNPFLDRAQFRLDLPEASRVSIVIYDVQGRRVADLLRGNMEAGRYDHTWSGRDGSGGRVARGIYFLAIDATPLSGEKTFSVRRKLILVR
ncbi:MAG: hypothetical protein AUI33_02040, partial [Ignavibacteria bacterium 13_1_40CM_2_61_4]